LKGLDSLIGLIGFARRPGAGAAVGNGSERLWFLAHLVPRLSLLEFTWLGAWHPRASRVQLSGLSAFWRPRLPSWALDGGRRL
jgi:hypothetical protein